MSNGKRVGIARRKRAVLSLCAMVTGATMMNGCGAGQLNSMLSVPTPLPVPKTPVKPTKPVFSATDYITPGEKRPGVYRVTGVLSGELITIQGVPAATPTPTATPAATPAAKAGAAGASPTPPPTPAPQLGLPETVHLAGIIAPAPNQSGWESAGKTISDWTVSNPKDQTIEVEDDVHYPRDAKGYAMVQVYFKGTTDQTASTRYNLNRMMIRSGYAVVDLYSATSIDVQKWLNDEQYARISRLGLWKLGITLAQRIPPPMPPVPATAGAGQAQGKTRSSGKARGANRPPRRPKGSAPVLRATPATSPMMTATGTPVPSGANTGVAATPGATPGATPPRATP